MRSRWAGLGGRDSGGHASGGYAGRASGGHAPCVHAAIRCTGHSTAGRPTILAERLTGIAKSDERLVIGLSSGTSFDGIDAALIRVTGRGDDVGVDLVQFVCVPFEPELRARIAAAPVAATPELARLNFDLGEEFAGAALELLQASGRAPGDVHLVGSHGQTVFHDPPSDGRSGVTYQIGEADVIARRTGLVTVSDFRTADVAAGGSGAPLVPMVDWLLFRSSGEARVLLNIGGIANITYVTERLEDVRAFDTGPGNALIDAVMELWSGDETIDEGGFHALAGTPSRHAVERFLGRPYFAVPPPKSTGKETFGPAAARELAGLVHPGKDIETMSGTELDDVLATAALVTARSISDAMEFLSAETAPARVIVSGGGVKNEAVMNNLAALFDPVPVASLRDEGMDPDAKEAVAFAVLADRTIAGEVGNVPAATGADSFVVLGKISPGM